MNIDEYVENISDKPTVTEQKQKQQLRLRDLQIGDWFRFVEQRRSYKVDSLIAGTGQYIVGSYYYTIYGSSSLGHYVYLSCSENGDCLVERVSEVSV